MWSNASEVAKKTIDQSAAQLSNLSLALRNKRSLEAYAQGIQEEFRQIIIRSGSKLLKKRKPIKLCKISLKCDDCVTQMSIPPFLGDVGMKSGLGFWVLTLNVPCLGT